MTSGANTQGASDFVDPSGQVQVWDLPPYSVTINFPVCSPNTLADLCMAT